MFFFSFSLFFFLSSHDHDHHTVSCHTIRQFSAVLNFFLSIPLLTRYPPTILLSYPAPTRACGSLIHPLLFPPKRPLDVAPRFVCPIVSSFSAFFFYIGILYLSFRLFLDPPHPHLGLDCLFSYFSFLIFSAFCFYRCYPLHSSMLLF